MTWQEWLGQLAFPLTCFFLWLWYTAPTGNKDKHYGLVSYRIRKVAQRLGLRRDPEGTRGKHRPYEAHKTRSRHGTWGDMD